MGLGGGSGAKERGEEEGEMGERERGKRNEGREREKEIGKDRGLGKIRKERGKNRKDKNEEMPTQDYKTWHIQ